MSIESPHDEPAEWEQFRELIELHKFYFENIIKAAAFAFGFIGAVVSYVIATDIRDRYRFAAAMTIPIVLSVSAGLLGLIGAVKLRELSQQVSGLQSKLRLAWRPHAELLPLMSGIIAILFFIVACGLVAVVLNLKLLPAIPKGHGV
jgi:hypothetical protein